jgi:hypothetical protein
MHRKITILPLLLAAAIGLSACGSSSTPQSTRNHVAVTQTVKEAPEIKSSGEGVNPATNETDSQEHSKAVAEETKEEESHCYECAAHPAPAQSTQSSEWQKIQAQVTRERHEEEARRQHLQEETGIIPKK